MSWEKNVVSTMQSPHKLVLRAESQNGISTGDLDMDNAFKTGHGIA